MLLWLGMQLALFCSCCRQFAQIRRLNTRQERGKEVIGEEEKRSQTVRRYLAVRAKFEVFHISNGCSFVTVNLQQTGMPKGSRSVEMPLDREGAHGNVLPFPIPFALSKRWWRIGT